MSTNRIPRPAERHFAAWILPSLLVFVCVVWCGGCFTKKASAYQITPVVLAHPIVPPAQPIAALEAPPDIQLEIAKLPARVVTPRSAPARPKVATAPPAEPAVVEKRADPLIVPDLTPEELSAAKSETQHSLDVSESNLGRTQGKALNSGQQDMVSKIRGFMESARDAMKNGDWLRAQSLAKKAEVLSRELSAKP